MNASIKFAALLLIVVLGLCALEFGARALMPDGRGFISKAQAEVGRPLTPVSVAGVARRTARRCAAGVYNC